jgi:hypothetical protein
MPATSMLAFRRYVAPMLNPLHPLDAASAQDSLVKNIPITDACTVSACH